MPSSRYMLGTLTFAALAFGASPDPKAGRKLFEQACGFCHGNDATGARGPDLIRSPLVNRDEDGKLIGPMVRNGRPEKDMPAFAYSDAQIADLAAFLHEQLRAALRSASVPRDYPLEKFLTRDAAVGKAYFFAPRHCHSCP